MSEDGRSDLSDEERVQLITAIIQRELTVMTRGDLELFYNDHRFDWLFDVSDDELNEVNNGNLPL